MQRVIDTQSYQLLYLVIKDENNMLTLAVYEGCMRPDFLVLSRDFLTGIESEGNGRDESL